MVSYTMAAEVEVVKSGQILDVFASRTDRTCIL